MNFHKLLHAINKTCFLPFVPKFIDDKYQFQIDTQNYGAVLRLENGRNIYLSYIEPNLYTIAATNSFFEPYRDFVLTPQQFLLILQTEHEYT